MLQLPVIPKSLYTAAGKQLLWFECEMPTSIPHTDSCIQTLNPQTVVLKGCGTYKSEEPCWREEVGH